MKIFLSHSYKHKPLVRELKSYLPEHLNLWLDEKELLIGDDISTSIQDAIQADSDFLVFFIDNSSIVSEWVLREINWALEKEEKLRRKFVLPLVLEKEAWENLDIQKIKSRKHILLSDYSESGIKAAASALITELFAWLSRDLNSKSEKSNRADTSLTLLEDADQFIAKLADKIRLIVYPYRKNSPLKLDKLLETLKSYGVVTGVHSMNDFLKLINRVQQQGYLAGLICDGETIYVVQEHYAWKTSFYTETKKKLAKRAVDLIQPGDIVALDAGSTTFEIASQICQELRFKRLYDMKVVTNSIPVATVLLELATELALEDRNQFLKVFITGGRVRPNSLAIVTDESYLESNGQTDFGLFLSGMGGADICFVGANGIYSEKGFAVHNHYEIKTKQELLKNSKKKIIVVDPSKFLIKEERMFVSFDEDFTVLTYKEEHKEEIEYFESLIQDKNIETIYA